MIAKDLLKAILPPPARQWLRRQPLRAERWFCQVVSLGKRSGFRRTTPVSRNWGASRGQIVDRYYIEKFLAEHAADVRGHVLDFGDDSYARRFGGAKLTQVDILHLTADNPRATIVVDLSNGGQIPSDTFDCILCTQVLLLVYNLQAAVRTLYRILRPGGVVLVTAPGIQKISRGDMETSGDYWRFTSLSLRRLFEEVFPKDHIEVKAYGNVLAATAFLQGLAVEDLRRGDLEHHDPDYEVSIALRAVK
ncbi:MAG: class I SAM-dependent methyltransferase [Terriglobia bacterium]